VNAELPIPIDTRPRWRRRLSIALRRSRLAPALEIATFVALIIVAAASYFIVTSQDRTESLLTPPMVAVLLVANLVPAMGLMVFAARRLAMARAAKSEIGGRGRLHVRLVALFSAVAAVPTVLVVIFASVLFQSGTEFWFSDRARGMLENAVLVAQQARERERERVSLETVTMAGDLAGYLRQIPYDNPLFAEGFAGQVLNRNLSEAIIVKWSEESGIQTLAYVNPYDRDLDEVVTLPMIRALQAGQPSLTVPSDDRTASLTRLPDTNNMYVYAARVFEPQLLLQLGRAEAVLKDYRTLVERSRTFQLRLNAVLLLVSLLIVGISIWIALALADRLVRPVGQLVDAARRVTAGDLSARVPGSRVQDEVATLGNAFNRMTRRLEEQTGALVTANAQLDSRRALTEAVLSGVTAGVISVDEERRVRLINSSAEALLKTSPGEAVGKSLKELAPELDSHLDNEAREDIVQLASAGEARTLAVKRVKVEGGHVLTFDDLTEQLLDQRRAAWSDVARRIAHEIKNPLTPIQLAAERLQRRYGSEITSDQDTFQRLTGTIVRQVGDLRRMVDEFSSFARMPKPVFRRESIADIAGQALFLHEVAHPDIAFELNAPDPSPTLVCDRRQLGQALTNIVKNGIEAIEQKRAEGAALGGDRIAISIEETNGKVSVAVSDTGPGLPPDRVRLTEPYMTTRQKGTGLGLAIVKKIVEEHFGTIEFDDAPGGGTLIRLKFDSEALARLEAGPSASEEITAGG
jgi:two-component system nitrogen regulation sensor histidine kinase NtrY